MSFVPNIVVLIIILKWQNRNYFVSCHVHTDREPLSLKHNPCNYPTSVSLTLKLVFMYTLLGLMRHIPTGSTATFKAFGFK